ncbi:MAG: hypothetical protein ABIW94_01175 [Gemmatimonadaceae bacterium]
MTWIGRGKVESAAGYDAFVFSRSEDGEGSWRAVWRTMSLDIPHQG